MANPLDRKKRGKKRRKAPKKGPRANPAYQATSGDGDKDVQGLPPELEELHRLLELDPSQRPKTPGQMGKGAFIPALRQGVTLLQMVFYKRFRDSLLAREVVSTPEEARIMAGAMVNRFFGETELTHEMRAYLNAHSELVDQELSMVEELHEDLKIPMTDALRMHFFLNRFEGVGDEKAEAEALAKAKQWGILLKERRVPWPKGFMEMAYRVGLAYGLLQEQRPAEGPTTP